MDNQILEKLFDSPSKLRILKLFLRNPHDKFKMRDVRKRLMLKTPVVNRELNKLYDIKLIHRKKHPKSKEYMYSLNHEFVFLPEMKNLVLKSSPADERKMENTIKKLGRIKLAVLSGIFVKPERENSRADLLIVGDGINENKLQTFIRKLEAEVGTEINYTVLTSEEYAYRNKMFDRFLRDIFEQPHRKLVDKFRK